MSSPGSRHPIEQAVLEQLERDGRFHTAEIQVVVSDEAVTLRGTVPDHLARQMAVGGAEAAAGGRRVDDQLTIRQPSTESPPDSDAVQAAVESVLDWLPDVEIRDRAIRARQGVVTIEGSVDAEWKKAQAAEAIRDVYGVVELRNELSVVAGPGGDQPTDQAEPRQAPDQRMSRAKRPKEK